MTQNTAAPVTLELAIGDPRGARIAADLGIDRVELCVALEVGGLSPSDGLVESVLAVAAEAPRPLEVHPLVRMRAGGFDYTDEEINVMVAEVASYARRGVDGVVIGALRNGALDTTAIARLVDAAAGIHVTLHRAFDYLDDRLAALDVLREAGIGRILTSGGANTVGEGREQLRILAENAGDITIMAGGGLRPENAVEIRETGVGALHFSARTSRAAEAGASLGSAAENGPGLIWETNRELATRFVGLLRP